MNIKLASQQKEKLANFCLDISKGLVLAAILGQVVIFSDSVVLKSLGSFIVGMFGLLFLYFSLLLVKR